MDPKTIKVAGKDVFVIEERFSTLVENWGEYQTTSGVQIRIKLSLNRVYRVVDQDGKQLVDKDGNPTIIINSSNIVITDPAPEKVQNMGGRGRNIH